MSHLKPFLNARRDSVLALLALVPALCAQNPPVLNNPLPPVQPEDTRLPNGKKRSDEILKAEYQKNLEETRELSQLAQSLVQDLEKDDAFVLSVGTLKKLDDIEKLTRRIRGRLKRY